MGNDTELLFDLPSVARKKVTAAFDGGLISSDGGIGLLAAADKTLGLIDRLACALTDARAADRVRHTVRDILHARVFAIAMGYEDGNDLGRLRHDPAFKLACSRLPETGHDLCSQPTISRFENMPKVADLIRVARALITQFCESFERAPKAIVLDIDDTVDEVHGGQQLSFFNAHEDAYCFKPIHIYDAATGRPVFHLLRTGKTPSGKEVRRVLRFVVRHIRAHWPETAITFRGDSHYGRSEAMEWCEAHGIDYIFGLPVNDVIRAKVEDVADHVRTMRAVEDAERVREYADIRYGAKSWGCERRVIARIEATRLGLDIRAILTSLREDTAEYLYADHYCARGNAENLIKLHKSQLKSDRTSCTSANANQMRLFLHTAAYWLMLTVREAIPEKHALAKAKFTTLRLALLKIGARFRETAHRVRVAFAAACPHAELIRDLFDVLGLKRPNKRPAPA